MTTEELQALEAAEAAAKIAEQRKRGRKLFRFGLVGMVALCGYYASIAHVEDPLHLYLGIAIIALSGLPSLLLLWWLHAQGHFRTLAPKKP